MQHTLFTSIETVWKIFAPVYTLFGTYFTVAFKQSLFPWKFGNVDWLKIWCMYNYFTRVSFCFICLRILKTQKQNYRLMAVAVATEFPLLIVKNGGRNLLLTIFFTTQQRWNPHSVCIFYLLYLFICIIIIIIYE
jgi:hypothetical protein